MITASTLNYRIASILSSVPQQLGNNSKASMHNASEEDGGGIQRWWIGRDSATVVDWMEMEVYQPEGGELGNRWRK